MSSSQEDESNPDIFQLAGARKMAAPRGDVALHWLDSAFHLRPCGWWFGKGHERIGGTCSP